MRLYSIVGLSFRCLVFFFRDIQYFDIIFSYFFIIYYNMYHYYQIFKNILVVVELLIKIFHYLAE